MKNIFTLWAALLLALAPIAGFAACSGQFNITYPTGVGTTTATANNGSANPTATDCPGSAGSAQLVFVPADAGTVGITRTINGVTTTLVATMSTVGGTTYTFTLPNVTASAVYALTNTVACNNAKNKAVSLTLAPSLTLNATAVEVCQGSSSTLTATGSTSGSYTWTAPGMTTVTNAGTLVVSPTATTVYTVTAPTSCSTTTTQSIKVGVPTLTAASDRTTLCSGTTITLTAASSEAGTTFAWTRAGVAVGSGASISVTPPAGTSTYRVTSSNPSGCANTSFVDVPVTVAAQTVGISPASASITAGQSATLTASSNLSGAAYTWRSGSTSGPTVGSTATITVSPPVSTTYFVTAVSGSCTTSQSARVAVTAAPGSPLPVELLWFEARSTASGTALSWATASERNSAYFEVQRSADGGRFETLSRVASAGNSKATLQYHALDAAPRPGLGYYRLTQTDLDGRISYSPVRTVSATTKPTDFSAQLYPNPLEASSVLRFDAPVAAPVLCSLRDALGREMQHYELPAQVGVQQLAMPDLTNLRTGLYYLVLRQGTQQQVLRVQQL